MTTLLLSRFSSSHRDASLFARFMNARAVARQRAQLAKLDDAQLADLGLTRTDAQTEARRPAWDVNRSWLA